MKNLLLLAVAFVGSFSYGSYTVCSSPDLYYSSVRHDFGTPPPPGIETGKLTIVFQGKVLVDQVFYNGEFVEPAYEVKFLGPKDVLLETGKPIAGRSVYNEVAALKGPGLSAEVEIMQIPVLCENTWAMVP